MLLLIFCVMPVMVSSADDLSIDERSLDEHSRGLCLERFERSCLSSVLLSDLSNQRFEKFSTNEIARVYMALGQEAELTQFWETEDLKQLRIDTLRFRQVYERLHAMGAEEFLGNVNSITEPMYKRELFVKKVRYVVREKGFSAVDFYLSDAKKVLSEEDTWYLTLAFYHQAIRDVRLEMSKRLESLLVQFALNDQLATTQRYDLIFSIADAAITGGDSEKGKELIKNLVFDSQTPVPYFKKKEEYHLLAELKTRELSFRTSVPDFQGKYKDLGIEWAVALASPQREMMRKIEGEVDVYSQVNLHLGVAELLEIERGNSNSSLVLIHLLAAYQLLAQDPFFSANPKEKIVASARLLSLL